LCIKSLRQLDTDLPDAESDDLIGRQALADRDRSAASRSADAHDENGVHV
jgi:hypothetical protein